MSIHSRIGARAVGALPLSIATSLAVESAVGIHPEIHVARPPVLSYDEFWINLRTLFRNFMGALDKETYRAVEPMAISESLIEEMFHIQEIVKQYSSRTKVVFYISNYKNMEIRYPYAVTRRDNTEAQKIYTLLLEKSVGIILKKLHQHPELPIAVFDLKLIPSAKKKTMIMTHIAFDLVSHKAFSHLSLIESHTGKIKEEAQWYTKYYQGKELSLFPFREDFIQVFGDSETFRPGDSTLRKELIALANKYKWNALITDEKIRYCINQMTNQYHKEVLKQLLV